MKREIINIGASWKSIVTEGFANEPASWLSWQMHAHKLKYLLAHADDGVIWGRLDGEALITSHDVAPEYSPPLRTETLQTARIFSHAGEVLVWRDEYGEWASRLIAEAIPDATPEWIEAFEEHHILWGTNAGLRERDFSLVSEGSQGIFHVVPLGIVGQIDEQTRPLRLVIRHYLKADDHGFTRIDASRLFGLLPQPKESNI